MGILASTNESQQSEFYYINGKNRSIETDRYGKTFYLDDNGKRVYINLQELGISAFIVGKDNKKTSNLTEHPQRLVNYYNNKFTESQERISFLEELGSQIKRKYNKLSSDFNNYLCSLGVKSFDEIENESDRTYAKKTYCNNLSDLSREKTRNSNQYFSECLTAFDYALEKGNWQNQLNLAQHVEDSLA